MIEIDKFFPKLKKVTVIVEMTGWVPPYLNARNVLKKTDPEEEIFVPNYENLDNVGDGETLPLYRSYFPMDHAENIIEDFEFSYYHETRNVDREIPIEEDEHIFIFSHPINNDFEREGITVLSGNPPMIDISDKDVKYISSINMTPEGWMFTYWHFLNFYNHDWENTNFNEHDPITEPSWDVFYEMFDRITGYFTDTDRIYNDIFKFGKDNFLFVDFAAMICDRDIENLDLFEIYNNIVGINEHVPTWAYHDSMFDKYREDLIQFLERPDVQDIKSKLEQVFYSSEYYETYKDCDIIGSQNYQNFL